MIYSGSSSEFSRVPDPGRSSGSMRIRIWILPMLIKYLYLDIVNKTTLNSIIKKNLSTTCICHFLFLTTGTVLQYTKSRIQREITFLFICSFIFCWILIRNNNSGYRSSQKFRIRIHNTDSWDARDSCDTVQIANLGEES